MKAEGEVVRFPSERVRAGESFDAFFSQHHRPVFKSLYIVTGNRQDAEELMQDAFLRLWERWDDIDRIEDPTAYLFRVAFNGFRMRRRRAAVALRKFVPVSERDEFLDAEIRADVQRRLRELTPRQRGALVLVEMLGYPSEEAAQILGVKASTVRALATKGRQALRKAKDTLDE